MSRADTVYALVLAMVFLTIAGFRLRQAQHRIEFLEHNEILCEEALDLWDTEKREMEKELRKSRDEAMSATIELHTVWFRDGKMCR